jgi:protein-S-isoprenylcysteine O-methyltransferase Ste14
MQSKELLTFWLFLFSYSITVILSLISFYFNRTIFYPFLVLFLIGIGLRIYTKRLLGKFFHVNIVIHEDHKIIQSGIYKFIRHPMYLANFLIFLGIAGFFSSFLGIIAAIIFVIPTTILRIEKEEKYLKEKSPKEYKEYQEQSKKLIPYLY